MNDPLERCTRNSGSGFEPIQWQCRENQCAQGQVEQAGQHAAQHAHRQVAHAVIAHVASQRANQADHETPQEPAMDRQATEEAQDQMIEQR